jgi:HAD superfamily hydrolase (TIGR01450 family)
LSSIDGVLLRAHDPIPGAREALLFLQEQGIPFVLLTNGGGKHETERVKDISEHLDVPLDTSMFIQSHTPFADLDEYKDKTVLVIGGDGDNCRRVAEASVWLSKFVSIELLANGLLDMALSR